MSIVNNGRFRRNKMVPMKFKIFELKDQLGLAYLLCNHGYEQN